MVNSTSTPWYQRSIAQNISWVFSIIGLIATAAAVVPLFTGPSAELTATYQVSLFRIPDRLLKKGPLDTVIARQDTLLLRLYDALRSRLPLEQRLSMPDSLSPYGLKIYNTGESMEMFANQHRYLCVLTIKNEGDKNLNPVQILLASGTEGIYEYTDSDGKLQKGRTAGKFSIGELAPTEKREVYIWGSYYTFADGITLVYADKKSQAERPEEVTGKTAWLVRNWLSIIPGLVGILVVLLAARIQMRVATVETAKRQEEISES